MSDSSQRENSAVCAGDGVPASRDASQTLASCSMRSDIAIHTAPRAIEPRRAAFRERRIRERRAAQAHALREMLLDRVLGDLELRRDLLLRQPVDLAQCE